MTAPFFYFSPVASAANLATIAASSNRSRDLFFMLDSFRLFLMCLCAGVSRVTNLS